MATIAEFFGYRADDHSKAAKAAVNNEWCPFLNAKCKKTLSSGERSGVCTLKMATMAPVIICPNRLYAQNYKMLHDIAQDAFGKGELPLVEGAYAVHEAQVSGKDVVATFGKDWGGELRLPIRGGGGNYYVDWVLALVSPEAEFKEFVAVEVQSIDTTGNYREPRLGLLESSREIRSSKAGLNWENVNKRIIPQLIKKGNVLQRERLCDDGLYFVTPTPVFERIVKRLGGISELPEYPKSAGSITFMSYGLDGDVADGTPTQLVLENRHTTTVTQVAQAFYAPRDMPPPGVYERAIREALGLPEVE